MWSAGASMQKRTSCAVATGTRSSASMVINSGRRSVVWAPMSGRHSDGLGFQIFLDPLEPPFAADTRALVAAEGEIGRDAHTAIDRDRAGAHAARDAHGALLVRGDDHARQSIFAIVGDADRVLVVLVGNDHEHGTKNLLSSDPHLIAHIDEAGRLDEEPAALVGTRPAAGQKLRTLLLAELDVAH